MYEDLIDEQAELFDNLDSDSLFDYLIQNGVLEPNTAEEIRHERQGEEVNKALLEYLDQKENNATNHHALFINALRQTGRLQLANLLDVGHRIEPRRWNSLGYLNRTRHKGQVCLILQVNAVELYPDGLPPGFIPRDRPGGKSYWISLDELKLEDVIGNSTLHLQVSTSQQLLAADNDDNHHLATNRNSLLQLTIIEPDDPSSWQQNPAEKKSRCFCGCFKSLFGKEKKASASKSKSYQNNQNQQQQQETVGYRLASGVHVLEPVPEEGGHASCDNNKNNLASSRQPNGSSPGGSSSAIDKQPTNQQQRSSREITQSVAVDDEELRVKAETLHGKSNRFYQQLQQSDSTSRERLLTYFEQDRKILVLDLMYEDGIIIVCICTKPDAVQQLQHDFENGRLVQDLETVLVTPSILADIYVQSMKLQLTVEEDEFSKAFKDLQVH
ncbi:uncharacterized protein LOC141908216 [Tubulanus polymorphus]|uniref:uncharacterized protein LOC141908216 n=1 Tax=Tubulanus polymorphus TaxID=672921 RepID=UPI003DA4811F